MKSVRHSESAFGGKKYLLIFLISNFQFLFSFSFSQNPDIKRTNHWYFGEKAGLDFSSGTAVSDTNGQLQSLAGCAAISDTSGNLLFYSNGQTVWNKNHQVMPNGNNLRGHGWATHHLIVPKPGSNSLFYLLYPGYDTTNNPFTYSLFYSIVDISLNGGLGDVASRDSVLYADSASYKLGAINHANNTDVWILTMQTGINKIYSYLLTNAGFTVPPVITQVGKIDYGGGGGMKSNSDGTKIVITYTKPLNPAGVEILDFDKSAGVVSNPISIDACNLTYTPTGCSCYGISFSSDQSKLYFSVHYYDTVPQGGHSIYQLDVSSGDSAQIYNSKTLIDTMASNDTITFNGNLGMPLALQLAADKKIYLSRMNKTYLSIISSPNQLGLTCNFIDSALYIAGSVNSGRMSMGGLPTFLNSYLPIDSLVSVIEEQTQNNSLFIYPNPFNCTTNIIIPSPLIVSKIEMIDLLGRKTEFKKKITRENAQTIITLERNNLPAGIYVLNIKTNNNIYSQKLIITN